MLFLSNLTVFVVLKDFEKALSFVLTNVYGPSYLHKFGMEFLEFRQSPGDHPARGFVLGAGDTREMDHNNEIRHRSTLLRHHLVTKHGTYKIAGNESGV